MYESELYWSNGVVLIIWNWTSRPPELTMPPLPGLLEFIHMMIAPHFATPSLPCIVVDTNMAGLGTRLQNMAGLNEVTNVCACDI